MSLSYPMTNNSIPARLDTFKRRVDTAIQIVAEISKIDAVAFAKDATAYKKVGGLHFAKIGNASVSWSFKKKTVAAPSTPMYEPMTIEAPSELLQSRVARFVR